VYTCLPTSAPTSLCCSLFILHSPFTNRLEDFENSCAAYEKALELSDDYLTYLNYAITLYTNDEPVRSNYGP
jgi:hypothetical protein